MGPAVAASTQTERGTARPAAASAMLLADGRLHLHHGPIDLVIGADGTAAAVRRAYRLAAARFNTILDELVGELDLLRRPLCQTSCRPVGDVAARMWAASMCHLAHHNGADYVTAMAAVAGAVADEILAVICDKADLDRAYVNNGGDIALFLNPAAASRPKFSIGICVDPDIVFVLLTRLRHPPRGWRLSGKMGSLATFMSAPQIRLAASPQVAGKAAASLWALLIWSPCWRQMRRLPMWPRH